jgi:DNA-binding response OmpR family regulator
VPFIFLTTKAAREDTRYGMELGADGYIVKPFTREELLGAVTSRPSLEAGESRMIYLVGRTKATLAKGTTINFGVQISSSPDMSSSNNDASFVATIVAGQTSGNPQQAAKLGVAFTANPATAARLRAFW